MATTGERFERAVSIMARLRAPGGCPWDREQTFDTIKPYTLEETYEVLEAIDARDWDELPGELGDLLLQVLFYSEMAAEEKRFSIDDVLDRLSNKLIDRHPHVFGDVKADTPGEVLRNWHALKAEEKRKRQAESVEKGEQDHRESVLAGVSSAVPSLMEAYKISSRVAAVGFDWPNIEGLFDKLSEETEELRRNLEEYPAPGPRPESAAGVAGARGAKISPELRSRLEDEVGDLLFVLVNIARYLALDPESALRQTNRKFRRRFQYLEDRLRQQGRKPSGASLDEMESLWQESKRQGKSVTADTITLRNCTRLEEFRACLALQKEVWGFDDNELVPVRIFSLAPKIGGQVIGAWAGETLVGFAFSIPGIRSGHPYLHSHMLAVKEGYRDTGLGRRIKLFQREDAIAHDYELLEWTFDPLEIKNAYLNLERLGAIARRYNINQYGITSSPLQGFLPTDRLVAEWWLTSRRVETLLSTGKHPEFVEEARVDVPAEIYAWKQQPDTRQKAAVVQLRNREAFLLAFSRGLACLGYERDTQGNGAFLLGRWDEDWSYASK